VVAIVVSIRNTRTFANTRSTLGPRRAALDFCNESIASVFAHCKRFRSRPEIRPSELHF
jgi:hypothetical protein